jgi:siroheme decarboxylase
MFVFLSCHPMSRRMQLDSLDMCLLQELEKGLPLIPEPFDEIAERLGLSGPEALERIQKLHTQGIIRKFRARINQRLVGISANALVAWKPESTMKSDTGSLLAAFSSVTHCYERHPVPGRWEFTLYTVHHGCSRDAVRVEIKKIADQIGIKEYIVLFSTVEFKRVPNVRIRENGSDLI